MFKGAIIMTDTYYRQLSHATVTLYDNSVYQRDIKLMCSFSDGELPAPQSITISDEFDGLFNLTDYTQPTQKGAKIPIKPYRVASLEDKDEWNDNPFYQGKWIVFDASHGWYQQINHQVQPLTKTARCIPSQFIKNIQVDLIDFAPCQGPLLYVNFGMPHQNTMQVYASYQWQLDHQILTAPLDSQNTSNNKDDILDKRWSRKFIDTYDLDDAKLKSQTHQSHKSLLRQKIRKSAKEMPASQAGKMTKTDKQSTLDQWNLIQERWIKPLVQEKHLDVTAMTLQDVGGNYQQQMHDHMADIYLNIIMNAHDAS